MATPIQRVDNAIAAGLNHPNPAVVNVFTCLQPNLNGDVNRKTLLGAELGLGAYMKPLGTQAKADKKDLRNQVRAALLLYLTIGGGTAATQAFKTNRKNLSGLNAVQLNNA